MERTVVDNRYEISGPLGGGDMGTVYLARDGVLDRDVALKVLREQYAGSEEFVDRFEREAKAAASLNHPHIVSVYDRGRTEDGTYYIAMEHVPGGTLKDRVLRDGPLGPVEAVRVGAQVAGALGVAHAGGIVHRDVKPQNVLLTTDGDAKVADFGIARAASEASLSSGGLVLGTAKYMFPEQAMGDPTGPESDLYSLGVVLYEMLTGEVPFEADSAVGVAMKHVTEPPRPLREVNPAVLQALDAVVMRLLQKKPGDRYPGAAELIAELERTSEGLSPAFAAPLAADPSVPLATQEEAPGTGAERPADPAPVAVPRSPSGAREGSRRAPRTRRRGTLLVAAATLLALIGLAAMALSSGARGGPVVGSLEEAVEGAQRTFGVGQGDVPGVVGLTEQEARDRLAEEGFGVALERRESAEEDEGRVLEQSVPAGKEARRGSRVALAVGGGPRTARSPRLVGLTPAEAEDRLREAGLKVGGRKEAPSEDVPEGKVAAQDPPPGKEAQAGTEVDLVVSSGPPAASEPGRVEVPEVSGLGVDGAAAALEEAGCEVAGTREEPSPEPEGKVVGTDPSVGTAVASGTPVILVVSGGPAVARAGAGPDPGAAPSAPASPSASPGAPDTPEAPPEQDPPSSPAPSSPAPSSPTPSSPAPSSPSPSSSPGPSSPGSAPPAASSPSTEPSSAAPASPAPSSASAGSGEEDEEDEAEDDE